MRHLNIKVYGRVQGTFFRVNAQKKADELGITGFARNEPDGTVYIEAEGEEENLQRFLNWCREGPPWASVEKVENKPDPTLKGFSSFETY